MDFQKTHSTEIRPENILFAGAFAHFFSPEILRAWGSEGVNLCGGDSTRCKITENSAHSLRFRAGLACCLLSI